MAGGQHDAGRYLIVLKEPWREVYLPGSVPLPGDSYSLHARAVICCWPADDGAPSGDIMLRCCGWPGELQKGSWLTQTLDEAVPYPQIARALVLLGLGHNGWPRGSSRGPGHVGKVSAPRLVPIDPSYYLLV